MIKFSNTLVCWEYGLIKRDLKHLYVFVLFLCTVHVISSRSKPLFVYFLQEFSFCAL